VGAGRLVGEVVLDILRLELVRDRLLRIRRVSVQSRCGWSKRAYSSSWLEVSTV
jgi:hypothetical protein